MTMSRLIVIAAALLLTFTYFFPLWHIGLDAPQYPEGLGLDIYINEITGTNRGDLDKINNLNHYIGMKRIEPDSIQELSIMPWIMRFVMVSGILVGIVGRRRWLAAWLVLFVVVAGAGLVDFYLWGYDYGHNLDMENAIIKIPGMTYQPPVIGTKQLLNFKALSVPGLGGWIAIISFVISFNIWLFEWKRHRKQMREKETS